MRAASLRTTKVSPRTVKCMILPVIERASSDSVYMGSEGHDVTIFGGEVPESEPRLERRHVEHVAHNREWLRPGRKLAAPSASIPSYERPRIQGNH